MPTVDYYAIYTPKNKLFIQCDPINEVHTTGSISTTHETVMHGTQFGSRPNIRGQIGSHSVCTGYTVSIRYDGPVNIGDRLVRTQRIPNYFDNAQVHAETEAATGISREGACGVLYSTTALQTFALLSLITCTWPIYRWCYRLPKIRAREAQYLAEFDKIASNHMARDIAGLLKEADESLMARIDEMARQEALYRGRDSAGGSSSGSAGMITVSAEQLAQLMATAAAQFQNLQPANMPVVVTSTAAEQRGSQTTTPVITPQYQQSTKQAAAIELAERPATNEEIAIPGRPAIPGGKAKKAVP